MEEILKQIQTLEKVNIQDSQILKEEQANYLKNRQKLHHGI